MNALRRIWVEVHGDYWVFWLAMVAGVLSAIHELMTGQVPDALLLVGLVSIAITERYLR